jgi:hypothetical protein
VEVRGYLKEGNNGKEMANGAYFMDFLAVVGASCLPLLSGCAAAVL